MALNSKVVGQTVRKMFNVDGKAKGQSPVNKALFKTVDTRVRGGLINGWPTQEIANLMATDVVACRLDGTSGKADPGEFDGTPCSGKGRFAVSWADGGLQRWTQDLRDVRSACSGRTGRFRNCRCEALLIDPEDEFWKRQRASPVGAYTGNGVDQGEGREVARPSPHVGLKNVREQRVLLGPNLDLPAVQRIQQGSRQILKRCSPVNPTGRLITQANQTLSAAWYRQPRTEG